MQNTDKIGNPAQMVSWCHGECQPCRNNADDIQTVMTMLNDHPFPQEIIANKAKPPSVILYTPEQILDIKKCCIEERSKRSVLGIDRTFNLGPCVLTLTVFKMKAQKEENTRHSVDAWPTISSLGWIFQNLP